MKRALFFAALLASAGSAYPQRQATILKQHLFVQTAAAAVAEDPINPPWKFHVVFDASIANPAFVLPGGVAQPLALSPQTGEYDFSQAFPSQAALDSAFPDGTYQAVLGGEDIPLQLNGGYPNPPAAQVSSGQWQDGALVVDPGQAETITLDFTTNCFPGSAYLEIAVSEETSAEDGYTNKVSSASDGAIDFNLNQLSLTLPPHTLANGAVYNVQMILYNCTTVDQASVPGLNLIAAYSTATSFSIKAQATSSVPVFSLQPSPQIVAAGRTVAFNAAAEGPPAPSYAWLHDGLPIAGATGPRLVLSNASAEDTGTYQVIATNSAGSTSSQPVELTVSDGAVPGRLTNLSVLALVSDPLAIGFVQGGPDTGGTQNLLLRGVAPALAAPPFDLTGTLPDPSLELIRQSDGAILASNSGWAASASGAAQVTAADALAGAFPLTDPLSRDSALVVSLPPETGGYSAQIFSPSGAQGSALAEIYDLTTNPGAASPRLINLSCRARVGVQPVLGGFVVGGATGETVLIRASGPALAAAPFQIADVLPDPTVSVSALGSSTVLAANAGWEGDPQIAAAAAAVGAFAISDPSSGDAAVLLTLPPGAYSAEVNSQSGSSGAVLLEIYEVP